MKYRVYVSTKNSPISNLRLRQTDGLDIPIYWKSAYFKGFSRVLRDVQLQYREAKLSKLSLIYLTSKHFVSIFTFNPFLVMTELVKGYEGYFELQVDQKLPFEIWSTANDNSCWTSRYAAVSGINTGRFGPEIEWDRLRFSKDFSYFIWGIEENSLKNKFLMRDTLEKTEIEIHPRIVSETLEYIPGLNFHRLKHCKIYNGTFSIDEKQVYLIDRSNGIEDTSWPTNRVYKSRTKNYIIEPQVQLDVQIDRAIFLGSSTSWYHFLVEILPRFLMAPITDRQNWTVVTRFILPKSIQEVIHKLGFAMIMHQQDGTCLQVEDLLTVSDFRFQNALDVELRRADLLAVRSFFDQNSSNPTSPKRIYLKRDRNLFRPLVNQKKIEKILRSNGFEVINPGLMSLQDQVDIFQNASVVVSESGAALTGMLFMKTTSLVIELNPGEDPLKLWSRFAKTIDLQCVVIDGKPSRLLNQLSGIGFFKINTKHLKKVLESI